MVSPVAEPQGRARPRLRGWLHLVGAVLMAASTALLWRSTTEPVLRLAAMIYASGVTAMLATSATYHVPNWSPRMVAALRRADHSTIFLAVAGTFTPIVLATMPPTFGTVLLALVWVGATAGIVVRNVFHHARPWARIVPYVALGWVGVITLPWLWRHSTTVAVLVAAGGLLYTLGAVVYARRRPDPWPRWFGYHEVFHALTLVAITLHWFAVQQAVST
ncbi:PAQR family membrane homeostasis protein TrhA [Egicoccus halophilus]|uniref:Membrane protein n=1 Tax=Egicoccus halophilus TaxID=1670830 RepID=A0A8J3ETS3_9ACTN|nr:hemolysin III family protein [Egicoccus halophilus]GGI06166.1 membrane protein [Egicoccus halophilus]